MVLLNLIASLSLVAAVGVPAVVSSQSEIEESSESFVNRKNASGFFDESYVYYAIDVSYVQGNPVIFDGILPYVSNLAFDDQTTYQDGYGVGVGNVTNAFFVNLLLSGLTADDQIKLFIYSSESDEWKEAIVDDSVNNEEFIAYYFLGSNDLAIEDYYRVVVAENGVTFAGLNTYLESKNIVPSITNGLGVVSNLASGLVGGFDSLALNDGALTNVMAFAFTLLGIGTAVGVAKLCFNWVTGRHGM